MLLGCAIGDAFGAGVEFRDGRWIHEHVDGSQWVTKRGDPVLPWGYKKDALHESLQPAQDGVGRNFQAIQPQFNPNLSPF